MTSQFVTMAMYLIVGLALIWLILALLSAKWPSWKPVRKGYTGLLRAGGAGISRFFWAPGFERKGGGQVAQIRIPYQEGDQSWR